MSGLPGFGENRSITPRGNDPALEPYLDMIFNLASCLSGASPHYTRLCDEAVQMLRDAKHSTTLAMEDSRREPPR